MTGEASQQLIGESSDVQVIVVLDLPEMGFHVQSTSETALLVDLGEVASIHAEVQENIPPKPIDGWSDKAKSTWAGQSRPLLPNRLLLNFYIPP